MQSEHSLEHKAQWVFFFFFIKKSATKTLIYFAVFLKFRSLYQAHSRGGGGGGGREGRTTPPPLIPEGPKGQQFKK